MLGQFDGLFSTRHLCKYYCLLVIILRFTDLNIKEKIYIIGIIIISSSSIVIVIIIIINAIANLTAYVSVSISLSLRLCLSLSVALSKLSIKHNNRLRMLFRKERISRFLIYMARS